MIADAGNTNAGRLQCGLDGKTVPKGIHTGIAICFIWNLLTFRQNLKKHEISALASSRGETGEIVRVSIVVAGPKYIQREEY